MVAELRKAVEDSGLSLAELARRSGVSHGQLSRFLRGERLLALDVASRLFSTLGLRIVPAAEKPAKRKPKK